MPGWRDHARGDPLPWLLERDETQPGVRCFALRDIVGLPEDDPEVRAAQARVMETGPVLAILAAQNPDGSWTEKSYRGTVSQVGFLAQLGADGDDQRVRAGCAYLLDHLVAKNGALTHTGQPSNFIHCGSGITLAALIDLGWSEDERVRRGLEWHARTVTGDGVAPMNAKATTEKFYKSGTTGPGFGCAMNGELPCGWGAIKAVKALGRMPKSERSAVMERALEQGIEFLLGRDPAIADYPFAYGKAPSSRWFQFGFPHGYIGDFLEILEVLALAGAIHDPRLTRALQAVEDKQDSHGRWKLEHTYAGKMWIDIETKGEPSKWVTLRALRVLKAAYGD